MLEKKPILISKEDKGSIYMRYMYCLYNTYFETNARSDVYMNICIMKSNEIINSSNVEEIEII